MIYEHGPSGTPASPDIDMGLPEVCEICDRDCPELCEAFKRFVAVKTWLIKAKAEGRISMSAGFSLGLVLGVEE